jgi:uncharacterized Tic20 family protein
MNPFKILHFRKMFKEARSNPSGLAGEQVREILWGIVTIPLVLAVIIVALFFIIGYTDLFGFQFGFFKLLFWIALVVGFTIFSLIRKIIFSIGRGASRGTKRVIDAVVSETKEDL